MIKALNIISDKNIGGAGRCIINFLKYYNRDELSVIVVMPKGSLLKTEIEALKVKVIEVSGISDKSFDMAAIGELKKIIDSLKPDIVHTHGAFSGRIAARLSGAKVVYTRHSVFPVSKKFKNPAIRKLNGMVNVFFADGIIAVAEAAAENLIETGVPAEKITVILNGVSPIKRLSPEAAEVKRAELGIENDDFVMSILARLERVKGHKYIIEAASQLKKENRKFKIIIAGTGPEEENLKELAREKGVTNEVIFTGFVKNVSEILSITDAQLNASFGTEATSLALLEGLSLGIPAIVSNYGGNPGVITNGENGLIFEPKDTEGLLAAIKRLMDDKCLYKKLKEGAERIFNKKFTANIYAANIEGFYEKIAHRRRK